MVYTIVQNGQIPLNTNTATRFSITRTNGILISKNKNPRGFFYRHDKCHVFGLIFHQSYPFLLYMEQIFLITPP